MERVTRLVAAVPSGHGAKCDFRRAGIKQLSTGQLHLDGSSLSGSQIQKKKVFLLEDLLFYGAGDEARTRYLHLGKVALYRMSYTRNGHDLL